MKSAPNHPISGTGCNAARRRLPCCSIRLPAPDRLRYERRHYRLKPGETMLVMIPHNHRYWLAPGEHWEYFWISMHGREALRIHREILAATGPVFRLRPETIEHLARCTLRFVEGEGETPGAASAIAYEAAMALFDEHLRLAPSSPTESDAVSRVIRHILENLDKPLAVPELAEVAGFSRRAFHARVHGERGRAAGGIRAAAAHAPRRLAARQRRRNHDQGSGCPDRL